MLVENIDPAVDIDPVVNIDPVVDIVLALTVQVRFAETSQVFSFF